jgi:hypothetical protein
MRYVCCEKGNHYRAAAVFVGAILALCCLDGQSQAQPSLYNVRDHGARGDGASLDTAAIQAAVDACHGAGGGTVWTPPGRYLTGTIRLLDNVTLHLEPGAVLLGSTNLDDYPPIPGEYRSYTDNYTDKSLIRADGAQNIAITGKGIIDGQGAAFTGEYKVRPYMIRFVECRDITMRDVTLQHGAMWTVHFLACEAVNVDAVTIRSRCNKNNDGLDIDSCRNVRVSNCDISSGDDAIVLKSTSARSCELVTINNCVLSTAGNALKMGTESNGGFQHVAISNCVIYDTNIAGIALEIVDGGVMDGVVISNIAMKNVNGPIFIRLGNRARPYQEGMDKPGIGALRNVTISNIEAVGANNVGCSITGLPGHPVENVTLDNIRISFEGGGTADQAFREIPEQEDKYPEYKMFGPLPAYGLYCRHAVNLSLSNIELRPEKTDERPAFAADDVEGLQIDRLEGRGTFRQTALLYLNNVRQAMIQRCQPSPDVQTFLRVDGAMTSAISVMNNDFHAVKKPVELSREAPADAVYLGANRQK